MPRRMTPTAAPALDHSASLLRLLDGQVDRPGRRRPLRRGEVETSHFKGPRDFDGDGLPLHIDDQTIVKERLFLDKANPDILHDEITTIDHALTHPWTVMKSYTRETNPIWVEYDCNENNIHVRIGTENYFIGAGGFRRRDAKARSHRTYAISRRRRIRAGRTLSRTVMAGLDRRGLATYGSYTSCRRNVGRSPRAALGLFELDFAVGPHAFGGDVSWNALAMKQLCRRVTAVLIRSKFHQVFGDEHLAGEVLFDLVGPWSVVVTTRSLGEVGKHHGFDIGGRRHFSNGIGRQMGLCRLPQDAGLLDSGHDRPLSVIDKLLLAVFD